MSTQHPNKDQDTTARSRPGLSQCAWCYWIINERGQRLREASGKLPDASHGICVPCLQARFPQFATTILAELDGDCKTYQE